MIDSDVAYFFGVTVSSLNRQMRRNVDRFPSDFCFQLSDKETNDLRCQKGTTNLLSSKRRYNPYAYTEEGIITLAGVLKNDIAAKMSVEIARKFIQMRRFILEKAMFYSHSLNSKIDKSNLKMKQTESSMKFLN